MATFKDLTNMPPFGRLTAIEYLGASQWFCTCECGNTTVVMAGSLISGHTKSCGCARDESSGDRLKTHGRSYTPEYCVWNSMMGRCNNKNNRAYKYYGGRGIKVCKRWHSFAIFFKDMGERPKGMTLERKNNDKNYSPKNCIWATRRQQARNRRSTHMETYNGKTRCITEWCEIFKIDRNLIYDRLRNGWSFIRAITTPKQVKKHAI